MGTVDPILFEGRRSPCVKKTLHRKPDNWDLVPNAYSSWSAAFLAVSCVLSLTAFIVLPLDFFLIFYVMIALCHS